MAGRASEDERSPLETLALAGVGALALAAERADELADAVSERLGIDRDEVRSAVSEVLDSWRRELERTGEKTGAQASRVAEELGVASRQAIEELELRVAQLEHRLKLLERSR
jgi:polyhydroxyalkanoate synthesis regulator phasin